MPMYSVNHVSIPRLFQKALPIAMLLALSNVSYAEESFRKEKHNKQQLINSAEQNVFQQYGISEETLKLGLSSISSKEQQVERVKRTLEIGDKVKKSDVFLVQSIDTRGNIDLRIKYDQSNLDDSENVIETIEQITKTEYRLRSYMESYDKSSVIVDEISDNEVEISFNYSKYGLPQDIAYFRFMRVKLTVLNGVATKMVMTNSKSFEFEGFRVQRYSQEVELTTLVNGQTVIKNKIIEATGNQGQKKASYYATIEPVAFYDDEFGVLVFDEESLKIVSDPRIREEKVDLDRLFPLMSDLVRQQGIDVPLPYGFSVAYRNQDMDVGFNSFDIMGVNLDEWFDPSSSIGTVNAESYTFRADVNILPFWNVYGFVGKVEMDAVVDAQYTGKLKDVLKDKLGVIGGGLACGLLESQGADLCSPGRVQVPLHLDYDLAGIGTTLSVGYKEFFASVTTTYSSTKLDGQEDWGDGILTVQPMLGYQFLDYRAQVFVGAEYQGLQSRMTGNLGDVLGIGQDFTYDVDVEIKEWAYLIGFNKQIGRNLNLTGIYNKGESRSSFTLNFGYHF